MVSVCVVVSALFLFMAAQLGVCESTFVECKLGKKKGGKYRLHLMCWYVVMETDKRFSNL